MDCASVHRNLGVHVSFARSTVLDSWTVRLLRRMKLGGNGPASLKLASLHGKGILSAFNHGGSFVS